MIGFAWARPQQTMIMQDVKAANLVGIETSIGVFVLFRIEEFHTASYHIGTRYVPVQADEVPSLPI